MEAVFASSRPGIYHRQSLDDPMALLAVSIDDILLLWEDPIIRDVLSKHPIQLDDDYGL
jgi:hypothetical protein